MTQEQFEEVVKKRVRQLIDTVLVTKAKEYMRGGDRLHNFKRAGAMQGISKEKALIGMLSKHLVSVMDMVEDIDKGVIHSDAVWDEKLGDAVNYLILLEACIKDSDGLVEQVRRLNEI